MTDTPDPAPVISAFRADDESSAGVTPLGKSGWLTATIGDTAYRLRSPLFGELKKLRTALQVVQDEITAAQERQTTSLNEYVTYVGALAADGENVQEEDLTAVQKRKRDQLAAKSKQKSRELIDIADDRRADWWRLVFETLSVDGLPDDWPAWVVDISLPTEVMNHWRTVPLAPGR